MTRRQFMAALQAHGYVVTGNVLAHPCEVTRRWHLGESRATYQERRGMRWMTIGFADYGRTQVTEDDIFVYIKMNSPRF